MYHSFCSVLHDTRAALLGTEFKQRYNNLGWAGMWNKLLYTSKCLLCKCHMNNNFPYSKLLNQRRYRTVTEFLCIFFLGGCHVWFGTVVLGEGMFHLFLLCCFPEKGHPPSLTYRKKNIQVPIYPPPPS